MKKIKKGDKVSRRSYGEDIIFEVIKIIKQENKNSIALLKGITERIEVDSPIEDLVKVEEDIVENKLRSLDYRFEKKMQKNRNTKEFRSDTMITGKILHLDGDKNFVYNI